MTGLNDAIERVQEMRDETERDQLWTYCFDWMGEALDEDVSVEELRKIHVSDDWATYQGYEKCEIWEGFEGQLLAYDGVLNVLQSLAHGIVPG